MWFFSGIEGAAAVCVVSGFFPSGLAMKREVLASTGGSSAVFMQGKAQASSLAGRPLEAP